MGVIGNGGLTGVAVVGEMFISASDNKQMTLTSSGFSKLDGYNTGVTSFVEVDAQAGQFIIKVGGTYKFSGIASFSVSTGADVVFSVFVNNVGQPKTESNLSFKNNQDTDNFAGTSILELNKDDILDIRASSDTTPVTLSIKDLNVSIHQIEH